MLALRRFLPAFWKVLDKETCKKVFEIIISADNQACIADATSGAVSDMSKHIDLKF